MKNLCKTICLLLFLFSCSNDDLIEKKVVDENCISDEVLNTQLIFESQNHFEKKVVNSIDTAVHKGVDQDELRKKTKKTLHWDKAFIRELSFGTGVVVPLTYEKELYIRKVNSSIALSDLSYMLFYVDNKGKMQAELVTALPDETYTNSTYENQPFSGVVLVEDWHGNFLKGFLHQEEHIKILGQIIDTDSKIDAELETCFVTEYYLCQSIDDWVTEKCFYLYTTRNCFTIGMSGGSTVGGDYEPMDDPDGINKIRDLNNTEQTTLLSTKKNLSLYCPNQFIINAVWNSLKFIIDPSIGGPAGYDPVTNTISFRDNLSIKDINIIDELFHAYQNYFYPGGTAQYKGKPGATNLEFEAKFFKDLYDFYTYDIIGGSANINFPPEGLAAYTSLIFDVYDHGFNQSALDQYSNVLGFFLNYSAYRQGTLDIFKKPNAFINVRSNCN